VATHGEEQLGLHIDSVVRPRLDVQVRRKAGGLLLAADGVVIDLNEVAAVIWREMDGRRTIRDIGKVLSSRYGIDADEAAADVLDLSSTLMSSGMLRR
jgi:hypothetical protein